MEALSSLRRGAHERIHGWRNPGVQTAFTDPHDIAMASRQVQYKTLSPQDQQKQEEWAQEKAQTLGPCPAGYPWLRVPGGYNCRAGPHWVSDELLAEGKGGFYNLRKISLDKWKDRAIGFSDGLARFTGPIYDPSKSRGPLVKFGGGGRPRYRY